jgi:hypothetical protein
MSPKGGPAAQRNSDSAKKIIPTLNTRRGLELRYLSDEDVLYRVLCHFQGVSTKSAGLAWVAPLLMR